MITRKTLYDLHRKNYGDLARHARLSANVLSRLTRVLDKYQLPYNLSYSYYYQLVIRSRPLLSVHAAGWDTRMDVLPLKRDGSPYNSKYERSFMTPKGLINYILKKYGGEK